MMGLGMIVEDMVWEKAVGESDGRGFRIGVFCVFFVCVCKKWMEGKRSRRERLCHGVFFFFLSLFSSFGLHVLQR